MKKIILLLAVICFAKLIVAQVSLQAGSAVFNLPLFEWKDDKSRLSSAISLNYASGNGLKVNDIASNIGQGWKLMGLGVITRIQVGQPDDQRKWEPNHDSPKKYPNGSLYNNADINQGCPDALYKYPIYGNRNQIYVQHNSIAADRELDYFTYQFGGNSGLFALPRNNNNQGVFLNNSKMKVWFEKNDNNYLNGIRTTINSFYIQDQDGFIYKFSTTEITSILKYAYMDPKTGRQISQPRFEAGKVYHEGAFVDNSIDHPKMINSWYLSEIKDPLTNRVITFNYNLVNITTDAGISLSYFEGKDYSIVSHSTSKTITPEITSIQYPDGHQILFGYGSNRMDLPGARAMSYLDIKYANRYVSKYDFKTSYFIRNRYGNPTSDFQIKNARLCLLGVKRTGVDLMDHENPYTFDYYLGSDATDDFVPPPFFYARDIWGYYNGTESKTASGVSVNLQKPVSELMNTEIKGLCFFDNNNINQLYTAKAGFAKNGLIKQIVYPTGGILRYEYAQNQYNWGTGIKNAAGVRVSRTLLSDGGYSNDCNNPLITNYEYKDSSNNTSLWGLETPINKTIVRQFYKQEGKKVKYKPIANVKCVYHYQYPGILSRDQAVSLTSKEQTIATLSTIMDVVSAVSTAIDIIAISLHAGPQAVIAIIVDVVNIVVGLFTTCSSDPKIIDETINVYSNSDINSINPLPAQFRRVEIIEGAGINGKTVMEFTSPYDPDGKQLWVSENQNTMLSMQQRFPFWAYGLLRKTIVVGSDGFKVKETENNYDYYDNALPLSYTPDAVNYISCKCRVEKSVSQPDTDWNLPSNYDDPGAFINDLRTLPELKHRFYWLKGGHAALRTVNIRTFKPNSSLEYLEQQTTYFYAASNLLPNAIFTISSNGDIQQTYIKYTSLNSTTVQQKWSDNNILNIPVSTATLVQKPGQPYKMLSEIVTQYGIIPNGDIRPSKTLEQRFSSPQYPISYYNGPDAPSNPVMKATQSYFYNNASELAGIQDEGGRSILDIYDYDSKFVVASVINVDPVTDKVAYTSFETSSFGGWVLNGSASYNTISSSTGKSAFILSSGKSLTSSLTPSKSHIVSFWANNHSVTVSGGTLSKAGPTINDFTYYEYIVQPGSGAVVVQGNATIDELRSYPAAARMRTLTYDEIIGKTSECDENNRITYYEYDALGRLKFIKDEAKNIVKMNEYNVASYKPKGCTTNFTNKAIVEQFTKNNCSAGYIGSVVTYTIPAAKYSSSRSQEHADMLAEMELEQEGQNYANSYGSCIQVFGNDPQSRAFTKEGCTIGEIGSTVTYSVAGDTYYSTVSKTDANNMALAEIEANGDVYANEVGACSINANPVWEAIGDPQFQCEKNANNQNTGTQLIQVTDVNPNSATYNQTSWKDAGTNTTACPLPPVCNTSNCTGEGKKCVNGICEMGIREVLDCVPNGQIGATIYYRYRWSNGQTSSTYQQNVNRPCTGTDD